MTRRPPKTLDEIASAKWKEIIPQLDVQQGTLDALTVYCQAWSRWVTSESKVAELGAVIKSPQGFAIGNPYLAISKDSQRQLRQWGDVLGLHRKQPRQKAERASDDPILKLIHRAE